eukprot:snap_masked-scaffold_2-processed-gene-10.28-mRNA-1 protein AED:0.99 eAED:1.00 QI:0/0/0/0.5/1/1/2/0/162
MKQYYITTVPIRPIDSTNFFVSMLIPGSVVKVLNNTAVKSIRVIATFREGVHSSQVPAGQGDCVLGSVVQTGVIKDSFLRSKKHLGSSQVRYKKGDLVRGLVVRTKKEYDRSRGTGKNSKTGIMVSFPLENSVVLLSSQGQDAFAKTSLSGLMRSKGFSRII